LTDFFVRVFNTTPKAVNDYFAMLHAMLSGSLTTLSIFFLTLLFAIPLALFVAMGRMSKNRFLSGVTNIFLLIIRGTPLMLQLLIVYFVPKLIAVKCFHSPINWSSYIAAIVAFSINYSAYFAEIYRGGIESISRGQYEAAQVLGYTKTQTFIHIILPQVVKRIMPSITNEVVTLVKDTSIAFTVSYQEMFTIGKQIANSQTSFTPFVVAGVFYFVFNAIVDFGMGKIEKALDYYK